MTEESLRVINPADGSLITTVRAHDESSVENAARRAHEVSVSRVWSGMHPRRRGEHLQRLADLMARDHDQLARLDSEDGGKPITDCLTGDVPDAIETIQWFGEIADKTYGRVAPTGSEALGMTTREPFGVVGAITPWNYPLAMAAWKIGPALAAGNSLLLKPAEATPRSALHVEQLALEAGIPAGVLTVLPGYGAVAGAALASSHLVGAISFTGSTRTGRSILTDAASSNFKRVSLEMGGKSPQVLLEDALTFGDNLFEDMVLASFLSSGQNCTAGSRILVHSTIADDVTARFAAAADRLLVGHPADPSTRVGPLINEAAFRRVTDAIESAKEAGAMIVCGGVSVDVVAGGHYLRPTVLSAVPLGHDVWTSELFGPVVAITTFESDDQAVALANDTSYGLAASLWTKDIDRAIGLSRRIEAGVVSINAYSEGDITTPFGGWKQSGFGGAEKSTTALEQWTREKTTWIRTR